MLELSTNSQVTIKINGAEHKIKRPNIGQAVKLSNEIKAVGDNNVEALNIMREYFISLGLPAEIIDELTIESFSELALYVTGAKKN